MTNLSSIKTREKINDIQLKRLKELVSYVYENVPFYKNKFDNLGLLPGDIKKLEDIKLLPFTTKQDLRDNYPYDMFAAPMEKIIRIHASSGTTGTQTVVGYTKDDIDMWAELVADNLRRYGVNRNDIVQIAYGYGIFTGGLGIHYGVERVGAAVVPISAGATEKQVLTMKKFGTSVLACTPSYALHIYDTMVKMGVSPEELKLKIGIFGAEPWSDEIRYNIEDKFKIKAYDIYGLSEVIGPGVAGECFKQNGLHINEEHFIPEIISEDTLMPVAVGQLGEIVFTTLTKRGIPLIRYRTRDISSLDYSQCECGCNFVKMKRVESRSDDMLIIRGVNVYPIQIEKILLEFKELSPHYLIIVERENNLDKLTILVELIEKVEHYREEQLLQLNNFIKNRIHNILQISCEVRFSNSGVLPRSEGKIKRVSDKR